MAYKSTEKTRKKKDAKRTAMMQTAVRVFAKKGYYAATVRDIVNEANVAIGTFYFYFPDKETLFLHLYEETADFLLQSLRQAVNGRATFPKQMQAGVQAYINIALFEPAVIQLLLSGSVDTIPSLAAEREKFRDSLTAIWQRPIDEAIRLTHIPPQNGRLAAEILAGGIDEVILNLLKQPDAERIEKATVHDTTTFILRSVAHY